MALTQRKCGEIARTYLVTTAHKVAHFDKNAAYIAASFNHMLSACTAQQRCVCEGKIIPFSEKLASIAFSKNATESESTLDEDTFLDMCYLFLLCIFYHSGLTIGRKTVLQLWDLKLNSGCDEETTRAFLKRLTSDMCDLV